MNNTRFSAWLQRKYGFGKQNPLFIIGISILFGLLLVATAAPELAPYAPVAEAVTTLRFKPPSFQYPFGTDSLGRDIFSRVIWGSRISLHIVFWAAFPSCLIGFIIGVISGFYGGLIDELLMRLTDMFLAFPKLILAMAIVSALGRSLDHAIWAIAAVSWTSYARLARAETLAIREHDYIEAIRALGANHARILVCHIMPICLPTIIVRLSMNMGGIILTAAGLSFIGFGAQIPQPEWGIMVSDGRHCIYNQWWVSTFPALAIFLVVLGFNLVGDGLRGMLDPKQQQYYSFRNVEKS